VNDIEVLAANISGARLLDQNIVGILGVNFLRQFNFTIDYDTRRIVFDDQTTIKPGYEDSITQSKTLTAFSSSKPLLSCARLCVWP